ncbi:glycoside hydrolase family 3 C-terminal domain-containing protein [Saccharibacillus sp. JS10]|uniref:glycoside hydrolase family 3 C-terminal domain-containing protein n=1 Tax=Saccharibacillus sp. JS10 TaxID=2950552 RepID=UPI002109FDE9|nr:glycoside hydrolase family 3 C-terminal domain-containing protein [Saccharibacillus sp. JS10]MCQ4087876.1 glycoside hydrolase family 3 C-terminal domain-containing protein [Saccharibacillus sp. JS10]
MSTENNYPFQHTSLPLEERVNDLVSRFTLDEKVDLMIQYQTAVERLGVKPYKHGTEAAHGMAWLGEATGYPQPIGLSNIWDEELLERIGSAIGDEARGFYKRNPEINGLTLWAPTVDMERDPRWGRTEEAYGEDPILAGKLSASLVKGIQGDHPTYLKAVATLKHFIANNNEVGRGDASVSIDPRNMREYYLKAFEIPFKEGGAQSMMTSYNAVNGVPANLNPDVNGIVKGEWGMDGFVVSDAFDVSGTVRDHGYLESHTEAVARSVKEGGIDSLTDDGELMKSSLREALQNGQITEDDLDVALRNTFRVRFRLGEFDPEEGNPYAAIDESVILKKEHAELAREAARKAIVLLKNDQNLLPLQADKLNKVAVIGPLGDIVYRDWYSGELPYAITPLAGIQSKLDSAGKGAQATFATGTDRIKLKSQKNGKYVTLQSQEDSPLAANAESSDQAAIFDHTDWGWNNSTLIAESNGRYLTTDDRIVKASSDKIWEWFTKEVFLMREEDREVSGAKGTVTFSTWKDTPVTVGANGELLAGDGSAEETSNEIDAGGTSALDHSAAKVLQADVFEVEKVTDKYEAAKEAAKNAEVAVVFVGNHPLINGKETVDRPDITLPESQEQLIKEVLSVNPNTVVVVIGSYPYALNWVDEHVPSVVYSTHAGQEVGRAIADVLFGEENPAGRVSMTWYKSVDQLPEFMDYDIIQGNRTYRYFDGEPLYPFGYGLSYTTFDYQALKLNATSIEGSENAKINLTVTVKNTGEVDGEEVVQVYGRVQQSRVKRPLKQLLAFRRVKLSAGETKEIPFSIPLSELAVWDVTRERFVIEQASYTLLAGSSSANLPLESPLDVSGEKIPPRDLTQSTKAINYDAYEGVILDECVEGGSAIEVVNESGWIAFRDAEFGSGVQNVQVRVASATGGSIELRLGSTDGQLVGTVPVEASGVQQWADGSASLSGVEGRQDIYMVLKGKVSVSTFVFG